MGRVKKQKGIDVPESVCLFDAKEIAYIVNCGKLMPFEIDIQLATVLVTPDKLDEAEEHLTVRHLVNKFGFVVQSCIVAKYGGKDWKVDFKERKKAIVEVVGDLVIGIGANFTDVRENKDKRIFSESGGHWVIIVLDSMEPNYKIDKGAFDVGVKHGIFKLL